MVVLPSVPAALALAGATVLALSFGLYLALQLACGTLIWRTQDLKKRYNAEWALVTGASSGEGEQRPPPLVFFLFCPFECFLAHAAKPSPNIKPKNPGIGKSIADKLASQGLNVVMVALGDAVLDSAVAELKKKHPRVQLRKVGCDLGAPGGGKYMDAIAKQTRDVDVQLVFCNAGYILPGFFHTRTQEQVR